MLTDEDICRHCEAKPGAYQDHPFGDIPLCYKVCGRLFLQLYPRPENHKITIACDPMLADFYRQQFPGTVVPGYHCPDRLKPYMNTVYLGREVDGALLLSMIDHSYERALRKLSRKQEKELRAKN